MFYSRIFPLALAALFCGGAAAQSHLQVVSSNVDALSHERSVELFNTSGKTAVAYMLRVKEFDGGGKALASFEIGYDNLCFNPADRRNEDLIAPGKTSIRVIGRSATAFSIEVTVAGVVYDDRSFEGNWDDDVAPFFVGRANDAKEARAAIALLTPYPTSPEALRSKLEALRSMPHGIGLITFANHANLSPGVAPALLDKRQPIPTLATLTQEQWDGVVADLAAMANFWEAHSHEVRP